MVRAGDHAGATSAATPRPEAGDGRCAARRGRGARSEVETTLTLWCLIIGALLLGMALTGTTLQRLPLTTALMYLGVGWVLGGRALGLLAVDPITDAALLERVTELAVLIALFTAGLKLRTPLHAGQWILPLRLAVGAMLLTVGLVALVGVVLLHLPLRLAQAIVRRKIHWLMNATCFATGSRPMRNLLVGKSGSG